MRKLLPLILGLVGLAAGMGGGYLLRPPPEAGAVAEAEGGHTADPAEAGHGGADSGGEKGEAAQAYVKLNNQFVVPVVEAGEVAALVILSISLETAPGANEQVYAMEPKLRDMFLRVLFDHANAGGFRGAFTEADRMAVLRRALTEAAISTMGGTVSDVLIVDIVRQDV